MVISSHGGDHAQPSSARAIQRRQACLRRIIEGFTIGSRVRIYSALEQGSMFQTTILGLRIDGQFVFDGDALQFNPGDGSVTLKTEGHGKRNTLHTTGLSACQCQLVIAHDTEVGLRAGTAAAALGLASEPMAIDAGTRFVVVSTSDDRQNLCVETLVRQGYHLEAGVHVGRRVLLLDIIPGSAQAYEARSQPRVRTCLPVNVWLSDTGFSFSAVMLDFSESALRLSISGAQCDWPAFGRKHHVIVDFVPDVDKPLVTLSCRQRFDRGCERVFVIEQIYRGGEFVAFDSFDALGIQLDLLNFVGGDVVH